jgi:vitamin K-dependent gamma-carboxylase
MCETFEGVAKINEDWLRGEPLTHWLAARTETVPILGPYLTTPNLGLFLSWAGVVFELIVAPSLLFSVPLWVTKLIVT